MKKRILIFLGVAALAMMAVMVGMVALQPASPTEQSFRLPNGDVVKLAGVTYGTNALLWGKPYQQTLHRLLPGRLKNFSGCSTMSSGMSMGSNPQPVFWIQVVHQPGTSPNFAVRVVDEYGWEHNPNGYAMGSTSSGAVGGTMMHYQIDAGFPRGEVVGLCLYDSPVKTNRLGTFLLPREKQPVTAATTSPPSAPLQVDEMTFQLAEFWTGLKSAGYPAGVKARDGGVFSQATFRMTRNGRPDTSWLPTSIVLTGPDGATQRPRPSELAYRDDEIAFNFDGRLNPATGPWKLRVEFMHERDFAEAEMAEFRDVPFPGTGEVIESGWQTNVAGQPVTLLKLYGTGSERPTNTPSWFSSRAFAEARMSPVTNTMHFRWLSAVDERSNNVNYSSSAGSGGRNYLLFQQSANAKTVNLKFAVHRSRFVEFEAPAENWPTNSMPQRN